MTRYLVSADLELTATSAGDAEGRARSALSWLMLEGDIARAYVGEATPLGVAAVRPDHHLLEREGQTDGRAD